MIQYREPLDSYDRLPDDMVNYLRHNGWHFNKKLYEWAAKRMKRLNTATNKMESVEPWSKEDVDSMLTKYGIVVENNTGYDMYYVAAMLQADFYKSSITDEQHAALFIKDYVDDADKQDGFIMIRFYASMTHAGIPIPWSDVL